MRFSDFFSMMKDRISDGMDVPSFFRELISMITDVPDSEWGTPKDPATKLTKNSTLRTYSKRNLPQKFAQNIVYRLDANNFSACLSDKPQDLLEMLANDFKVIDPTANADNISEKLANCFVDIIRTSAGIIGNVNIESAKIREHELELKTKYGDYLLNENNQCCPFPGCGRNLVISNSGKVSVCFNVALIDRKKAPCITNLIALCPQCYSTYLIDDNPSSLKSLASIKKQLIDHQNSVEVLDSITLEKGIVGVIAKIKKMKIEDMPEKSIDPKEIKEKLNKSEDYLLYSTVINYVTSYYVSIQKIMVDADRRGEIDYDAIQDQMRSIFKKLKKTKKSNVDIFNEIVHKLHKSSLQDIIYCQLIVAYFIQKCEVFDAIT